MHQIIERNHFRVLAVIIALNVLLNLSMVWWGLPASWQPDEVVKFGLHMGKERSLDYGNYKYPALHIYTVAAALAPYYLVRGQQYREPFPPEFFTETLLIGRLLTIVYSALTLWVFARLVTQIGDTRTALAATALLAFNPIFLVYGHLALLDIPQLFWMLCTLYYALRVSSDGGRRDYLIAGLTMGITIATKYGWFVGIPLLVAHFVRRKRTHWHLLSATGIAAAVFVVTNPMFFLKFDAVRAALERLALDSVNYYGLVGRMGFVAHPYNLLVTLGIPLCLAVALGMWTTIRTRPIRPMELVLGSWIVVNVVLFGVSRATPIRYLLPVLPVFILIGARYLIEQRQRALGIAIGVMLLIGTAVTVIATRGDSRYAAKEWVAAHIPPEKTIGVFDRAWYPDFPFDNYHPIYRISDAEFATRSRNITDEYLVLVSFSYGRYLSDFANTGLQDWRSMPAHTTYFTDLLAGRGGYQIVATFDTMPNRVFLPNVEVTDPIIHVLQREAPEAKNER